MRHVDDCLDNLHCSEGRERTVSGRIAISQLCVCIYSYMYTYAYALSMLERRCKSRARAEEAGEERDALGREARSMRERGREGLGRTKNLRVVQFHRLGFTGGDLRGR
jgi:hypothetical protein